MLQKNDIKYINSLQLKKNRQKENRFVAEGIKVIKELTSAKLNLVNLYTTDTDVFEDLPATKISEKELSRISSQKTPNTAVAIFETIELPEKFEVKGIVPVFEKLNDPGNLGTIIRTCDWLGISDMILSKESVDVYNSKVVQSSMGSIARVRVHYVDLPQWLISQKLSAYGTFMDGRSVFDMKLNEGLIVFGNEANGISEELEKLIENRISIPQRGGGESLNVAMSAGIILSQFVYR